MVWQLDDELWFPDPHFGEDDGLIAIGGDLSIDRLLLAYGNGFFPWYAYQMDSVPRWYCPLDRYVIFPSEIHISHSMRQLLRQKRYQLTISQDFDGVIRGCSMAQDRNRDDGAWLGPHIIEAYTELFRQGFAASVEVWDNSEGHRLVGGLYGVLMGPVFIGESMFSLVPNASKLALIHLARVLEQCGGLLIDCQLPTNHLASMGARFISYEEYMQIMNSV